MKNIIHNPGVGGGESGSFGEKRVIEYSSFPEDYGNLARNLLFNRTGATPKEVELAKARWLYVFGKLVVPAACFLLAVGAFYYKWGDLSVLPEKNTPVANEEINEPKNQLTLDKGD